MCVPARAPEQINLRRYNRVEAQSKYLLMYVNKDVEWRVVSLPWVCLGVEVQQCLLVKIYMLGCQDNV